MKDGLDWDFSLKENVSALQKKKCHAVNFKQIIAFNFFGKLLIVFHLGKKMKFRVKF